MQLLTTILTSFIQAICIFNWIQYEPVKYDDYVYPTWAQVLGWLLSSLSIMCVPLGMVHAVYKAKGDSLVQVSLVDLLNFSVN